MNTYLDVQPIRVNEALRIKSPILNCKTIKQSPDYSYTLVTNAIHGARLGCQSMEPRHLINLLINRITGQTLIYSIDHHMNRYIIILYIL